MSYAGGPPTSLPIQPSPSDEKHSFYPPSRLQHSPSLPNIWFTSQPGQAAMAQSERMPKNGPSAPPSPKPTLTDAGSDKEKGKEPRPHHVKYASFDPVSRISRQGFKAHARRRTERDQPHALLTPPLTPSSSIRTTTSDAASPNAQEHPEADEANEANLPESFRALTIGAAGVQSKIRQRFNITGPSNPGKKDQQSLPQPIIEGTQSPPFFYTTPFTNPPNHDRYQYLDPAHMVGTFMGPINSPNSAIPSSIGPRYTPRDHDDPHSSGIVPTCYTPDDICSYCPSRTPVVNSAPFAMPCPTSIPAGYYPAQVNPHVIPSVVNVAPMPSITPFFPYEYMEPQGHPLPSVQQWAFDPAIAAVSAGPKHLIPIIAVNGPPPAPFLMESTIPNPQFHSQHLQAPIREGEHEWSNFSPRPFAHISTPTPDSSPQGFPSTSFVKHEHSSSGASANTALTSGIGPSTERNQLNLVRIKAGDDLRTTVMIKNIPNKMSDTDLTKYIDQVCPHRIDFLYLRMDFKNGCNVGYAFVNFITVQDLASFVEERLGTKWNMFSSEKILQMSYANFQGKEALIEKFKNSAIMDEREAWRPRIFYTSGENQGLPEPFPAPTHIRRKERSTINRGTLYPPGTNSHLLNNVKRRLNDEQGYPQGHPNERGQVAPLNGISGTRQRAGRPIDKFFGYRGARQHHPVT